MSATHWKINVLEPSAAGREAFWTGRPVWANPLTGTDAQEWRRGWNQGLAEFAASTGQAALPAKALQRQHLLMKYRPEDLAVPMRPHHVRHDVTHRRAGA
jgi:hypothetical protein